MSKMRFFALQELSNRKPLEVTAPSNKLSDYYGSHVFDRKKMQEYLPKEAYKAVIDAIEKGTPISREVADLVANGMESWAKSLNVTHYTHWFQPLTDGTAEKHDGFIEFGEDGGVIERPTLTIPASFLFRRHLYYCQNFPTLFQRSGVGSAHEKKQSIQCLICHAKKSKRMYKILSDGYTVNRKIDSTTTEL